MRTISAHRALAAASVVLCVALTGCSGDDSDPDTSTVSSSGDVAEGSGVPEECAEAFPAAFGEPDLGEVSLLPADWPEPVDDAVLCGTTSTVDDSQESADFATSAPEDEVLAAFEAALGDLGDYEVTREDPSGLGRAMLSGAAGAVYFQVEAKPGGYSVTFAQQ